MTRRALDSDDFADGDLVHHLLLDWRSRCASMAAPWQLATGRSALALCVAVVRTLEHGHRVPGLTRALRTWGAGVPSASEARSALQCLGESVSWLAVSSFGDFRARGLDPVLEALAQEAVIPTGRRTVPLDVDELTRCPLRATLARDLATAVATATAAGDDVTVAVLELDTGRAARLSTTAPAPAEDSQLLALLSTIRRTFAGDVYRVGEETFAVLAPGVGAVGMGELVLQATCVVGPRFHWGTASLRNLGPAVVSSPDLLLLVAEADLHVRREDMARVATSVTHHRQAAFVGAAAAALLLLAGIGLSFRGGAATPSAPTVKEALPAQPAPHRASTPSTTTPPAQATTTTNPAPPAVTTAPPAARPSVPAPAPPPSNPVLTTSQTPLPPAATPPPAPPPSNPSPPPPKPAPPSPPANSRGANSLVGQLLAAVLHGLQGLPPGRAHHLHG